MDDVKCPYCGSSEEINHDDGVGYEEGVYNQQLCGSCDKYFVYQTSISYSYDVSKADCLNDSEHKWKANCTYPKEYTQMECVDCGERRYPTDEEKEIIMAGDKV